MLCTYSKFIQIVSNCKFSTSLSTYLNQIRFFLRLKALADIRNPFPTSALLSYAAHLGDRRPKGRFVRNIFELLRLHLNTPLTVKTGIYLTNGIGKCCGCKEH